MGKLRDATRRTRDVLVLRRKTKEVPAGHWSVECDLPEKLPVTTAEVDVLDRMISGLIDELLRH